MSLLFCRRSIGPTAVVFGLIFGAALTMSQGAAILLAEDAVVKSSPKEQRPFDINKVERTIAKQPKYETDDLHYALLVYGPEGKRRCWVVFDGDRWCYIDRNGNGDLTEAGERLDLKTELKGTYNKCQVDLPVFAAKCKLTVQVYLGRHLLLSGEDVLRQGYVRQFAASPKLAQAYHFGGPLSLYLQGAGSLDFTKEALPTLTVLAGTPVGSPPGGPIYLGHILPLEHDDHIPKKAHVQAEVTFQSTSGKPITKIYELKTRC